MTSHSGRQGSHMRRSSPERSDGTERERLAHARAVLAIRVYFLSWLAAWVGHQLVAIFSADLGSRLYVALGYIAPFEVAGLIAMPVAWRRLLPHAPDFTVYLVAAGFFSALFAAYYWSFIAAGAALLVPVLTLYFSRASRSLS